MLGISMGQLRFARDRLPVGLELTGVREHQSPGRLLPDLLGVSAISRAH